MNDTLRYILAGALIFLIILLQPIYLDWLGYDADNAVVVQENEEERQPEGLDAPNKTDGFENLTYKHDFFIGGSTQESFITISTPLYTATLTNRSGGSFVDYTIRGENSEELKYMGGYDIGGSFHSDLPVSLVMPSGNDCMPCLAHYDDRGGEYDFINKPYLLLSHPSADTVFLDLFHPITYLK